MKIFLLVIKLDALVAATTMTGFRRSHDFAGTTIPFFIKCDINIILFINKITFFFIIVVVCGRTILGFVK